MNVDRPDQRRGEAGPPSVVMQAYREMTVEETKRLAKIGSAMIFVGVVPIIAGIFYELSAGYYIFTGLFVGIGVCFIFPPLGMWVIDVGLRFAARVVPSARSKIMPDRRTPDAE